MKMAKASKADLDMAMELCNALDALTQRWGATVPDEIAKPDGGDENEYFDRDDREQCQRVLGYLLELADRASLMRVVWGCAVMLDPTNKCVDPNADTIEHHPDLVNNAKDAERYRSLRRGQKWSVIDGIGNALRADDLDAAIDEAMAVPANGVFRRAPDVDADIEIERLRKSLAEALEVGSHLMSAAAHERARQLLRCNATELRPSPKAVEP